MIVAAIRRGKGLEGLVSGYTPDQVEVESTITGTDFGSLYEKYGAWLNVHLEDERLETFLDIVTEVLTPEQINAFLQGTIQYEGHHQYFSCTGNVINKLIQNSYNAGHNNFTLDMPHAIDFLANELRGTAANPLTITINGDVKSSFGDLSEHVVVTVCGNVGTLALESAKNSVFTLYGSVGYRFAFEAKNCTFTFHFQQGKKVGFDFAKNVENCTFKTTDFDKAKWIYGNVSDENVYFIDGNGKEKLITDLIVSKGEIK